MTQREAHMDLKWRRTFPGQYRAILPDIPGFTTGSDDNFVELDREDSGSWMFSIWLDLVDGSQICLFNRDFDIPFGSSFEEMKQAVENLSIEDITRKVVEQADKLVDDEFTDEELEASHQLLNQYATARKNTRRTAALDLQWYEELDDYDHLFYYADLPEVPGYTDAEESESYAQVYLMEDYSDVPETPGYEEGAWGFHLFIDGAHDMNLYADDFGLPPVESAEEAMSMVDNLSLRDIADMLDDMGYGPIDNPTASRHASKRTASMDLNWWKTSADTWAATLPEIPGFPKPGGGRCTVGLNTMVNDNHEPIGYGFDMNIFAPNGVRTLWEDDFGFGYADTGEEAKQEVESLSPEMIAQAAEDAGLEPVDNVSASRKGKHMIRQETRRTASMNLDWVNPSEDVYQADLPAIPGYTEPDGNESFVTVTYDNDGGVEAVATIFPTQGGVVNLDCWNILEFIPQDETLEDVMQAFDDLDVYDFSYALDDMGIEPMVDENGEYAVASRRTARMDLNWEFNANMLLYEAALPDIPGYPGVDSVDVWKDDEEQGDRWCFALCQNGYPLSIRSNEWFGIPSAGTAEEMMDAVEDLDPQEIADVLAAQGYEPDED